MKRCPACGTEYPADASFCTQDRTALHPFESEADTEQLDGLDPMVGGTAQETLVRRVTERPMSLEQALPNRSFPPDLERAVSRALAHRPRKRYATAAEFGRAVAEVVERRLHDLAELPRVAADATRVAMPDSLRSRAALTVAAGHIADGELRAAREWYVCAYDLTPESNEEMCSNVKAQIDQLARARD